MHLFIPCTQSRPVQNPLVPTSSLKLFMLWANLHFCSFYQVFDFSIHKMASTSGKQLKAITGGGHIQTHAGGGLDNIWSNPPIAQWCKQV